MGWSFGSQQMLRLLFTATQLVRPLKPETEGPTYLMRAAAPDFLLISQSILVHFRLVQALLLLKGACLLFSL
jgi:hypothetical protein